MMLRSLTILLIHHVIHLILCGEQSAKADDMLDFCLNESFNVTCSGDKVVLILTARFGRMKAGRCISGDFNLGCSKDVKPYLDSQCSSRSACEVSIRSLVDLHPCQRDFVSYLEASYLCIEVSGLAEDSVCHPDGQLRLSKQEGYLARPVTPPTGTAITTHPVGTDRCPWTVTVERGQRVNVTLITVDITNSVADGSQHVAVPGAAPAVVCSSTVVVIDDLVAERRTQVHVCADRRPLRHLMTSAGNRIQVHVTGDVTDVEGRVYLLHYTAVGCPELWVPSHAWAKKISVGRTGVVGETIGESVMIRCNDSMETWYLTCQGNRWLGDLGNCTQKAVHFIDDNEMRDERQHRFNGVIMAIMIGILLGIFIGMVLLMTVHVVKRRSRKQPMSTAGASLLMVEPKDFDEVPPPPVSLVQTHPGGLGNARTNSASDLLMDVETRVQFAKHGGTLGWRGSNSPCCETIPSSMACCHTTTAWTHCPVRTIRGQLPEFGSTSVQPSRKGEITSLGINASSNCYHHHHSQIPQLESLPISHYRHHRPQLVPLQHVSCYNEVLHPGTLTSCRLLDDHATPVDLLSIGDVERNRFEPKHFDDVIHCQPTQNISTSFPEQEREAPRVY